MYNIKHIEFNKGRFNGCMEYKDKTNEWLNGLIKELCLLSDKYNVNYISKGTAVYEFWNIDEDALSDLVIYEYVGG